MDEKFENRLIEIVMRNGKLDESLFNYSKEEKEKFLKAADLKELADILEETEKELFYCEDTDKVKELVETSKSVETEIENTCRKILAENGVDIENAIGERMDERKKIELLKQQLESFGIDERTAEELGLTDLETLKTDGKNFTFVLENPYAPTIIRLTYGDREELYKKINLRVRRMFEEGLEQEVRTLWEKGLRETPTASQAIGYKEFYPYFDGEISLEQVEEDICRNTRRYAKRQETWFSRMHYDQLITL